MEGIIDHDSPHLPSLHCRINPCLLPSFYKFWVGLSLFSYIFWYDKKIIELSWSSYTLNTYTQCMNLEYPSWSIFLCRFSLLLVYICCRLSIWCRWSSSYLHHCHFLDLQNWLRCNTRTHPLKSQASYLQKENQC